MYEKHLACLINNINLEEYKKRQQENENFQALNI